MRQAPPVLLMIGVMRSVVEHYLYAAAAYLDNSHARGAAFIERNAAANGLARRERHAAETVQRGLLAVGQSAYGYTAAAGAYYNAALPGQTDSRGVKLCVEKQRVALATSLLTHPAAEA